jgi:invasion protein IalB
MKRTIIAGLTFLSMLAAGAVNAQDNADNTGFPIGADQNVQPGQIYLKEKSGAFEIRCIKATEGNDPCQLYQLLNGPSGNPIAEISLFHLPGGGAAVLGAEAITPLGTLLTAGLGFQIGEAAPKSYPFNWCMGDGCVSRLGFTGLELEALKRGNEATLVIYSIEQPNEPIQIKLSLDGFSDGFSKILVK